MLFFLFLDAYPFKAQFSPSFNPWSFVDQKGFESTYQNWMKSAPTPLQALPTSQAHVSTSYDAVVTQACAVTSSASNGQDVTCLRATGTASDASDSITTEFSPDSKPMKHMSNDVTDFSLTPGNSELGYPPTGSPTPFLQHPGNFGVGLTSQMHGQTQTFAHYPYLGASEYTNGLFHSSGMFKAATLARVAKKRSSTGRPLLLLF